MLVCGLFSGVALAQETDASVIINEIHVDPDVKTEQVEFIELYNRSAEAVDLSYWTLGEGVQYFFPPGSSISPGGYLVIAQNPAAVQAKFGVEAAGPYVGRLDNEGDEIVLRNHESQIVDSVSYGLGFPWPIVGEAPGHSMELVNPALDNSQGNFWRPGGPTPGQANSLLVDNPPPNITSIEHHPRAPKSSDVVRITAAVTDTDGVAGVWLLYQLVAPGAYIRLEDPAYASQWTTLAMAPAGDGLYTVEMPAETRQHRYLVRYRVFALDAAGHSLTVPFAEDPQPNFAYFVYDAVPPWQGAIKPGESGALGQLVTYNFAAMRPLPVYHFLAQRKDVEDAQFIPNSTRREGYFGDDYLWRGTLVYDGQVYDHILFRARGGFRRFAVGKNMWKFNFHPSHRFQAYDDYGRPYPEKWDKLNFSAVIQHANRGHRGEQGLFESVGFRLFNLAGVEAPRTHFVHFRVIDDDSEQSGDQYSGDFWGLYLAIEEPDGQFLDAHGLPDGNLYKMDIAANELNNLGPYGPVDKSDLNQFINGYLSNGADSTWWRQNLDLPHYYSYRAIIEAIHHYDVDEGKNYHYYRNPETGLWSVIPWDIDATWADTMPGTGMEPFATGVLTNPELQIEYQNRLREIRDLLFNLEQVSALIDEYAALVNTPVDGLAMVDADRAKWDYNPILVSSYVNPGRGGHGYFYQRAETHDFAGMAQLMKNWVVSRSTWIDQTLLKDAYLPQTPAVTYIGPADFPADALAFEVSPFSDANAAFAALQWRAAVIAWPGLPGYTPGTPHRYEIEATWQSEELETFTPAITLPPGACPPGFLCRVRARMKNSMGRWSHWSDPVEFVTGSPGQPVLSTLKITEIMYHPPRRGFVPGTEFEFVELKNTGVSPVDLTGLRFTKGIDYAFPPGATLGAGEFLVLAANGEWFNFQYGFPAFGVYEKQLDNKTDHLVLTDAFSRTVFSVIYQDEAPWPMSADGLGFSLVLNKPSQADDPHAPTSWRASSTIGGSPGAEEIAPVIINEVLSNPAAGQTAAIELHNPAPYEAYVGGWHLSNNEATPQQFTIPAGVVIPPGGYLVVNQDSLLTAAFPLAVYANGGELHLFATNTDGSLNGYVHSLRYGAMPPGVSAGRYVTADGDHHFPLQDAVTLGRANSEPAVGPVVISELLYRTDQGLEFIELTNLSSEPVKLYEYSPDGTPIPWRLSGVLYQFPVGVEIPARGKLVVASADPTSICTGYIVRDGVQVVGPVPLALADNGQYLALERPGFGTEPIYIVVDEVAYDILPPWPQPGGGVTSLERLHLTGYGSDPLSWRRGVRDNDLIQSAAVGGGLHPEVALCGFDVLPGADVGFEIRWATHYERNVESFRLWRSADGIREHAEQVAAGIASQGGPALSAAYTYTDTNVVVDTVYTYWLEAVGPENSTVDVGFTTPRAGIHQLHLPLVWR